MSPMQEDHVPTIDFRRLASNPVHKNSIDDLVAIGKEVGDALNDVGFYYINNLGIPEEKEEDLKSLLKTFLNFEEDTKLKYKRSYETFHGFHTEVLTRYCEKLGKDVKFGREYYDIQGLHEELPNDEIPDFSERLAVILPYLENLVQNCLRTVELGLGMPSGTLRNAHQYLFEDKSFSSLRLMKYHPNSSETPAQTVRLPSHRDWGTFAIQFFVDIDGLQLLQRNGKWHTMKLQPGRIMLFPGPLLERWTNGKIVATPHKVNVPEKPEERSQDRHTIILFVNADHRASIEPTVRSSYFPEVKGDEFYIKKAEETYRFHYKRQETLRN